MDCLKRPLNFQCFVMLKSHSSSSLPPGNSMSFPVQGMFNLFTNYIFNLFCLLIWTVLLCTWNLCTIISILSINFENPFMEKIVDIYIIYLYTNKSIISNNIKIFTDAIKVGSYGSWWFFSYKELWKIKIKLIWLNIPTIRSAALPNSSVTKQ